MDYKFAMINVGVLMDEELKASDKAVYAVLSMYADNTSRECFPSRTTIMKKAGVSDNTSRKALKNLSDKGYIKIFERRDKKGRRLSNGYSVL